MSTMSVQAPPVSRFLMLSAASVVALDADGRVLWSSPTARQLFERKGAGGGDQDLLSFIHPDDVGVALAAYRRNLEHRGPGSPFRFRFRVGSTGPWHWIEVTTNNQLATPGVEAVVATVRGIDSETLIEGALRESEHRLRSVVENAPVILIAYGIDGIITLADGQGFQALRHVAGELVGVSMCSFFAEFPDVEAAMQSVLRGEPHHTTLDIDGTILDLHSSPIVQDGVITGGLAIGTDVTDQSRAHAEVVRREERFRSLVHRSSDIAMIFDAVGTIVYISPAVRLFGYEPEDLVGTNSFDLCHPDDVATARASVPWLLNEPGSTITHEIRVRDAAGGYRWIEEVLTNRLHDPAIEGVVGNIRDITDRKEGALEMARRAKTDDLTGLVNRAELTERLEASIERGRVSGESTTIIFLDLDEFKLVNDSLGHASGDALLQQIGERLQTAVRGGDLVARFGGDEFVVLCEGGDDRVPELVAERVSDTFTQPFLVDGEPLYVSASIGVASSPPNDGETLLRHADAAMYRAKERGRQRIEFFDDSFVHRATSVLRMRNEMRSGLERDEFLLHYQPIVDLKTEAIVGMEALVRWSHPDRGLVPPLDFIPEAEDSGFIIDLGAWVIDEACREAATWPAPMHVAVNVSARQLSDHRIVATVTDALHRSGLDASALVLEVTESALMANAETALIVLNELRDLGVRLAIDDFGTGYSSLVYLKRMPVDTLKVDRSFVDGLGEDPEDSAIVASVIGLAHAVGVRAVAEGVETESQHRHLIELGCDLGQGYLWSRPVPASAIPDLLDRH